MSTGPRWLLAEASRTGDPRGDAAAGVPAPGGPALWVIAGPNGVGKTTYARRFLRAAAGTERFVNLDEIARGLSPLTPTPDAEIGAAAARIVLARIGEALTGRRSFAIETTLAGRTHLRTLRAARCAGFSVQLVFCVLPDVEQALRRIADRVASGGHAVPEADARRRWGRALGNFPAYAALSDSWRVLDTGLAEPRLVIAGPPGSVADPALWAALPVTLRRGVTGRD